jgi:hypothetical protein
LSSSFFSNIGSYSSPASLHDSTTLPSDQTTDLEFLWPTVSEETAEIPSSVLDSVGHEEVDASMNFSPGFFTRDQLVQGVVCLSARLGKQVRQSQVQPILSRMRFRMPFGKFQACLPAAKARTKMLNPSLRFQ